MRYRINSPIRIIVFTASLFLGPAANAQIAFREGSFREIMNEAARENKYIFIDAYVPWCGPCKLMAKNVFTDSAVASYYNTNFISLEMDVNDSVNKAFAQQYGITAYPTLMYFTPAGKLIFQQVGYHDREKIIASGKSALSDPDFLMQTAQMRSAYESGSADKSLLMRYYFTLKKHDRNCDSVGAAVVKLLQPADLKNDSAFQVWFETDQRMSSPLMDYFFTEHAFFQEKYPKQSDQKPRYVVAYNIEEARKSHDEARFGEVQRFIQHAYDSQEMMQMLAAARMKFQ